MRERIQWLYYWGRWKINFLYKQVMKRDFFNYEKKYGKNRFVSGEDGNLLLKQKILSGEPFAFCRFGMSEIDYVVNCKKDELWGTDSFKNQLDVKNMFELYPDDGGLGLKRFAEIMNHACETADFIGVWTSKWMGDYYTTTIKNVKEKKIGSAIMGEPYYFKEPWSEALANKKVLIINPFVDIIKEQYLNNRERLFKDKNILPKFELLTLKSIWFDSAGKDPRFNSWFEVYDYIFEEAMKKDFDIALLGCGTFGFPLAARFKEAGKQAIHIGGAAQILFGVMGKRWENMDQFKEFFNEYWVRPEKPQIDLNYKKLDNACYW